MKILIAFYSKTGNTEKISDAICKFLTKYEVELLKIKMDKEYGNILPHINPQIIYDTILNKKPKIKSLKDMSPYDVICIGTPNWYGRIAPPVSTFIEEMTNVEGKKVIGFVSSGLAKESYASSLKKRLEEKRLNVLKTLNLKLREISELQLREIEEILF